MPAASRAASTRWPSHGRAARCRRCAASSRAASSSVRRWRRSCTPASCRCASRASCRRRWSRSAYQLEYGSDRLQARNDALRPANATLIVDDVLATGGTLAAARELVAQARRRAGRRQRADRAGSIAGPCALAGRGAPARLAALLTLQDERVGSLKGRATPNKNPPRRRATTGSPPGRG